MRNVVPARALARRSRDFLLGSIYLFLFGLAAVIIAIFLRTIPLVTPNSPDFERYLLGRDVLLGLGVVSMLVAVGIAARALTWRRDNDLAIEIGRVLERSLDDRYVYIRNINRPALGYIDAVLVGPPGTLVFRIVRRDGTYFNEGKDWLQQREKGDWTPLRRSPSIECLVDVDAVREYLRTSGLSEVPVFGVVAFTNDAPATIVNTERPTVPVLQPQELINGLQTSYFAKDRINLAISNRVAELLFGNPI